MTSIFERKKIMSVLPKMKIENALFDIELLWRFKKIGTILEVPIRWFDDKDTRFSWKEVAKGFFLLIKTRLTG